MSTAVQPHRRGLQWGQMCVGLGVLLCGILLLFDRLDMVDFVNWTRLWPLIVICMGVGRFSGSAGRHENSRALVMTMVGVWLLICSLRLFDVTYGNGWPLLLVLIGSAYLILPRDAGQRFFGLLVAGLGVVFLIATRGLIELDMSTYWPLLVILGGLAIIFRTFIRKEGGA